MSHTTRPKPAPLNNHPPRLGLAPPPANTKQPALRPPGPRGHWLFGHLREYRSGRLQFLERLRAQHGPVFSYRLGRHPIVAISEPQLIEQVLVSRNREFGKFYITKMLRDVFGEGLLTSEGSFWLRQRRLIQPAFAQPRLVALAEAMVRRTYDCMNNWVSGETRDMLREMQELAMAIAAETLLGVQLPAEITAMHAAHDFVRADFDRRVESVWTAPVWIPTPYNRRVVAARQVCRGIVERLIAERRGRKQTGSDLLSRLLEMGDSADERLTESQIRDEAITFLFAGHETTASTLAWVWYLLAQHPQAEAQLHAEIDSVLQGRWPTAADVPRLRYTESVFRETLRLYPSAYSTGRRALADVELGEFHIPKGTNVILSQWLTHRDARFYDRPTEFDPDRWTPEFQKSLPHFAWFPFGGGPRVCIGNAFAMLEGVLVIAAIASRFRLRLVPGQKITPLASLTLRPTPGVQMICEPRRTSTSS